MYLTSIIQELYPEIPNMEYINLLCLVNKARKDGENKICYCIQIMKEQKSEI